VLSLILLSASILLVAAPSRAVSSAELYETSNQVFGRFEARIRFPAGDGVVGSFFLWKAGSDRPGAFWNELDFEKVGADCQVRSNALFGAPAANHSRTESITGNLCGDYHTYRYEWTPTYIAWSVDGVEVRRETGATATAYADNASAGMQIHFNVWPGDATFGGNFSPAILPVREYISWVQYSSFNNGTFSLVWREDFASGALPNGWAVGTWSSPKNLSTHAPANVTFVGGIAEVSLTADNATGFTGTPPADNDAVDASGTPAGDAGNSPRTDASATPAGDAGNSPGTDASGTPAGDAGDSPRADASTTPNARDADIPLPGADASAIPRAGNDAGGSAGSGGGPSSTGTENRTSPGDGNGCRFALRAGHLRPTGLMLMGAAVGVLASLRRRRDLRRRS
jgi:hypothetical protein